MRFGLDLGQPAPQACGVAGVSTNQVIIPMAQMHMLPVLVAWRHSNLMILSNWCRTWRLHIREQNAWNYLTRVTIMVQSFAILCLKPCIGVDIVHQMFEQRMQHWLIFAHPNSWIYVPDVLPFCGHHLQTVETILTTRAATVNALDSYIRMGLINTYEKMLTIMDNVCYTIMHRLLNSSCCAEWLVTQLPSLWPKYMQYMASPNIILHHHILHDMV